MTIESKDTLQEITDKVYEILQDNPDYQMANKIKLYLPLLYKRQEEQIYIDGLLDAFSINYAKGFYQFAYLQYHMIFMSSIYFMLLKVHTIKQSPFDNALQYMMKDNARKFHAKNNKREGNLYFGSFALISESDVFRLLFLMDMETGLLGELQKTVKERNKYAHANGNITIKSQETLNEKIHNYLALLEHVFSLFKEPVKELYSSLLQEESFYNPEIRQSADETEQIKEFFIKEFGVSYHDLNICRKIRTKSLEALDNFEEIKPLHISLCQYFKENSFD